MGGVLVVASREDGRELARYELNAAPVWDGMAAANSQLVVCLCDGSVICWEPAVACETNTDQIELLGDDLSAWREDRGDWHLVGEVSLAADNPEQLMSNPGKGTVVNTPTGKTEHLVSKYEHGDVEAHIEFLVPSGSNSGVFFQGRYEIQILDSWGKEKKTKHHDCGGIYKSLQHKGHPPRGNASLPPGQWQTYDIVFRAPRLDPKGKKTANAKFVKVVHNGQVIHENVEVLGPTRSMEGKMEVSIGPLLLQGDHGVVAYRNIWLRPIETD